MTTPNRTPRGPIPPSRPRTDQPTPAGDGKALADAIASKITAGIMPALNLERQTMTDQTDNSGYSDGGPIPLRPKSISTEATAVREASIAQARAEGRADALQAIRTDDQFAQQGLVDRLVDMSREHGAEVHELQLAVLAGNTTTQQLQQLLDSATRRADELAQQLDATGVDGRIEAEVDILREDVAQRDSYLRSISDTVLAAISEPADEHEYMPIEVPTQVQTLVDLAEQRLAGESDAARTVTSLTARNAAQRDAIKRCGVALGIPSLDGDPTYALEDVVRAVETVVERNRRQGAMLQRLQGIVDVEVPDTEAVIAGVQRLQDHAHNLRGRAEAAEAALASERDAVRKVEQHIEAAAELLGVTLYEAVPTEIEGLQRNLADERRRVEQLTEANRALRIAVESGRSSESAVGLFQLNEGSWGTAAASGSEQAPTPAERAHEAIGRVMAIANDLTDTGTGIEDDDTSTDSQRQVANRPLSE